MQFVFTLTCRLAFFLKLLVVYILSKELGCIVQIFGNGAYTVSLHCCCMCSWAITIYNGIPCAQLMIWKM